MKYFEVAGLCGLLVIITVIRWKVLPPSIFVVRDVFRDNPAVRDGFVGNGKWIAFSRRFGVPYIVGAFIVSFGWVFLFARLVSDTTLGGCLLFGPPIVLMVLGFLLATLRVGRWLVGVR